MTNIYVRKVRSGELTINQVPNRWRDDVRKEINKK